MANDRFPDDIAAARHDEQAKAAAEAARADAAQLEVRREEALAADARADAADLQRKAAVDYAGAEAAHRVAAENEALRASLLAQRAEAQANVTAAGRNFVDRAVGEERRRASTFTFGFALCLAVLLAALLVGALYMLTRPQTGDQVIVNAAPPPPRPAVIAPPAPGVVTPFTKGP